MESVFNLCDPHLIKSERSEENFTDDLILQIMWNLKPSFDIQIFTYIYINGGVISYLIPLREAFVTEEGACYSINALNSRDIFTEQYGNVYYYFFYLRGNNSRDCCNCVRNYTAHMSDAFLAVLAFMLSKAFELFSYKINVNIRIANCNLQCYTIYE